MTEKRFLDAVDAALARAAREADEARLPPALRARIARAAGAARMEERPRGRVLVLDWALRAAAVAATLAAVALVLPVSLEAAEFDPAPLLAWNERITASVAERIPDLTTLEVEVPPVESELAAPAAAGALVLVGVGLLLLRRKEAR